MEKIHNKLVRDGIIQIILNNNGIPIYYELSDKKYWQALLEKDIEELEEVKLAKNSEEIKEELADKLEVLRAMAEFQGFSLDEIIKIANDKKEKRGGFSRKLFLEKTID